MSIRLRITLWFTVSLVIVTVLTLGIVLSISNSVLKKTVQEDLISLVEDNADEVKFFSSTDHINPNDSDHLYIEYGSGYLGIEDDFLDVLNGISSALYSEDGVLIYGGNPIARQAAEMEFLNNRVQKISVDGKTYFIYDAALDVLQTETLWIRGVVSKQQGTANLSLIAEFSLTLVPLVLIIAIFGGYLIADRALEPVSKIANAARMINRGRDLKKRIELSSGRDELHKLADTFNDMFERLDEAFETERQFTSDVSHELRTPMSVIMAQCEFTLEKERTVEEYIAALKVIRRQGGKMTRLITDMLEFTRLERKADDFIKEPVDMTALIKSVCDDMCLIQERGIKLEYEVEENIEVAGDKVLLTRLVTNLISNAYRYGKENGSIKVILKSDGERVTVSVEDDGIGISPKDKDRIFNRFYRADSSRSNKGTGLGLSMAQEIARFHGGDISVESEEGVGSKFIFEIPKK